MGGKKKRSMKQMTKTTKPQKQKQDTKKAPVPEKKAIPGITPPNTTSEKFTGELQKMKVITPYTLASKFNLRMSIARELLRTLERKGVVQFVSKSQNLRIYKPAD